MVICLATGGVALDAAIGPHSGKGSGELGLVRQLLEGFKPGDVMLAGALYCNYFLIATLMAQGVDVLFEQNGSRITDFRRGQSLGRRDHIVRWPKPATRPEWMTPEHYAQAPEEITPARKSKSSIRYWSPRCTITGGSARLNSQGTQISDSGFITESSSSFMNAGSACGLGMFRGYRVRHGWLALDALPE
jgi:hypothetical protein